MKILQSVALSLFVMFASSFACSQNGPSAPSVVLSWVQSTTPGVTANCVYRGSISGQYKIPALFCSTAPITSYTDLTVQRGSTYFYAVTAQIGTTESGYSNEVSAMPIPVNPPSGNGSKTTKLILPDGVPISDGSHRLQIAFAGECSRAFHGLGVEGSIRWSMSPM